jgi:L-ascorbate metabolism protein UlaG (beta-lactamase superfamily)
MKIIVKYGLGVFIFSLALAGCLSLPAGDMKPGNAHQLSDHFDGTRYFNPDTQQSSPSIPVQGPGRRRSGWIWHLVSSTGWPEWPDAKDSPPVPAPDTGVSQGTIRVIPIGHATFLIQMDGLNILTDPIWSDRSSPLSWVGPKRHKKPGIRFEDLPPIDVVLVSHDHYDHLDLPTLKRLAKKGTPRSIVPLGCLNIIRGAGIPKMDEFDWWQSTSLSPDVTVTLVPAQHFSQRTFWDRNKTLWGGFVISGPSGNVYFAGDTGYGSHFKEIARHFSPIKLAILPIAPFQPQQSNEPRRNGLHVGPIEAVQTHIDLSAQASIAGHFQVFQLGSDGFDDAVNGLSAALKERNLRPDAFVALKPGQPLEQITAFTRIHNTLSAGR